MFDGFIKGLEKMILTERRVRERTGPEGGGNAT